MMERMRVPGVGASATLPSFTEGVGLHDEASVVLLFPILQVLQEVDKRRLVQDSLLGQRVKIERICEGLYEFELELEARPIRTPCIRGLVGLGHGQAVMAVCGCSSKLDGGCLSLVSRFRSRCETNTRKRQSAASHDGRDASVRT